MKLITFFLFHFLLFLSLNCVDFLNFDRKTSYKFLSDNTAQKLEDSAKVDSKVKDVTSAMQSIQKIMNNKNDNKHSATNLTKQEEKIKEIRVHVELTKQVESHLKEIAKEIRDKTKKADFIKRLAQLKNVINKLLAGLKKLTKSTRKIQLQKKYTIKKAEKLKKQTKASEKQFNNTIAKLVKKNEKKLKYQQRFCAESRAKSESNAREVAGLAKACFQGAISAVPGEFCWKKGADFGKIPSGCPANYERILALCFERCKSGYSQFGGVCWEVCGGRDKNIGFMCWKSLFRWHFKKSYIPNSLTNFNSRIPCPDGMYKSGALCYRDCRKISMVNCGIEACASSGSSCGLAIANMTVEDVVTIGGIILDMLSLGTASGLTTAAKTAASKIGKEGLKKAFLRSKAFIEKQVTSNLKNFVKTTAQKAQKFLAKQLLSKYTEYQMEQFCENTVKSIRKINGKKNEPSESFAGIDFLGVLGVAKSCSKTLDTINAKLECAKGVLEAVGNLDPTGIIGLAAAFVNPICKEI